MSSGRPLGAGESAAPNLLEALKNLVGAISEGQDIDPINSDYFADALAAIAKAEGND